MKNSKVSYLLLMMLFTFPILKLFPQQIKYDLSDNTLKDSLLKIITESIEKNDLSSYSQSDLIVVGFDTESEYLDYKKLVNDVESKSNYVKDFNYKLKKVDIKLNDNKDEATYFINYSCAFFVQPFNFKVENISESGRLKLINGSWKIQHQHASVPITNKLWPYYIKKPDAPKSANYKFSKDDLLEDLDLLTLALEEAHGRLYKFNPRQEYLKQINFVTSQINKTMTEQEFYKLISPIISDIKCGHTKTELSQKTTDYIKSKKKVFPFKLKFINNKAYIIGAEKNFNNLIGAEILSVNNAQISDMIQIIFNSIESDGGIRTAKFKKVEEKFHKYYINYINAENDNFQLDHIPCAKDDTLQVTVKGINYTEYKNIKSILKTNRKSILDFKLIENNNIALIDIRKFVSQEINQFFGSFKSFADSVFGEINKANVEHLIIDLRGNGGGDIGHELISYLIDEPVQNEKVTDTPNTRYSFLEYTDKGMFFNLFHPSLWSRYRNKEGRYELPGKEKRKVMPSSNLYRGEVYILIDGNTFSGASSFAAIMEDYNRATFFGEETGGCRYGANADDYINLTLPNTEIVITIPLRNGINNLKNEKDLNRGVIPQYKIANSISDLLNGNDAELDFVITHINDKRRAAAKE